MSWRQLLEEERFEHDTLGDNYYQRMWRQGRFYITRSPKTTDDIASQLHHSLVCPSFIERGYPFERGYAVEILIFLRGHDGCSCDRATEPDRVTWFLEHHNSEHGHYPLRSSYINGHISHDVIIAQLRDQLPSMSPGWIVQQLPSTVSYGRILRRCTTCRSVWT
jgi:hypothetical protein